MIAIIDYGAGNLKSVKKAFDFLQVESKIVSAPNEAECADKIVLPGVGAFGAAVEKLKQSGFYHFLKNWIESNKPFLGICLGMQLLFESSTESEIVEGLGVFKGQCVRFTEGKIPQIGWNQINKVKESKLLTGIEDESFFYFLHSYYVRPEDQNIVAATTSYGIDYPSVFEQGNIYAVQFHPEKSGEKGLQLLKNWVELC